MRLHLAELIWFSTYAELRAERSRSFLGLAWWLIEPAMMMAVFWLVFDRILHSGGPGYVPFLLIGLVVWQWMKSCVIHAGHAIWMNLALIRNVRLPVMIFPVVQLLADTLKFLCVFGLLLLVLWSSGYPPNASYCILPLVLVLIFLCAAGAGLLLAAAMPLLPDLRFVIEQVLSVLMFLSGVVFALRNVPEPYASWLQWNPVLALVDAMREVLLHGNWPAPWLLAKAAIVALALVVAGSVSVVMLSPRYPKIAA